jgi:hypothetical protein
MAAKPVARWYFAAAQALIATALMYWATSEYDQTRQALSAISLVDHWSTAAALLVILDLPAILPAGAITFALGLGDSVSYVLAILTVFLLWLWIGGTILTTRLTAGKQSIRGRLLTTVVGIVAAIVAFWLSPATIAVSVKSAAAIFWLTIAILMCRASLRPDKRNELG